MNDTLCESCMNLSYDEDMEEYTCCVNMDEDDTMRLYSSHYTKCPYFRMGDDYTIVKKQN